MDKLKELMERCKCGVFITVNEHRDYYKSAKNFLEEQEFCRTEGDELEIDSETRKKMIESDTIIEVHFCPDTPIGFYEIFDYDIDRALDRALACIV